MDRALLAALLLSLMLIAPGVAVAQDGTETPTETPESSYVAQVDPALLVADYFTDKGDLVIVFDAKVSRTVTISEAVSDGSGAGQFRIKQQTIPRGKTRVRFPADEVTITTSQSIQRGQGVYIDGSGGGNPLRRLSPSQGVGVGAAIMALWMVVGAARYVSKEGGSPEVAR